MGPAEPISIHGAGGSASRENGAAAEARDGDTLRELGAEGQLSKSSGRREARPPEPGPELASPAAADGCSAPRPAGRRRRRHSRPLSPVAPGSPLTSVPLSGSRPARRLRTRLEPSAAGGTSGRARPAPGGLRGAVGGRVPGRGGAASARPPLHPLCLTVTIPSEGQPPP